MQAHTTRANNIKSSDKVTIKIEHEGSLDIAEVSSRKDGNVKNRQRDWSYLVEKLSKTHYTAETHKEYLSFKRDRQDEIKDRGAFIGGYCANGKRKAESILYRQLLTLDADNATSELWNDFRLVFNNAAVIYSTHKHSPTNPRYRLIIPLDRQVIPDEFRAISRRIAHSIGMENFDHSTSFKPSQIMYWPSTSKDGVYDFQFQDGPWLKADEVLATYDDWKDCSSWPVHPQESSRVILEIKRQGDPLEKPGVVGAFCRTYDIHEAVSTFLNDVYEECDIENRYTFKEGSTSAGVVVYEDKYSYSHHGTDPTSGKLCNSFDLVRLHKFGLKDVNVKANTPINRYPSQIAMEEFATKDKKVRLQIGIEKTNSAKEDFADLASPDIISKEDSEWLSSMDVDSKGNYLPSVNNIELILENDPALKGRIVFDEFAQCTVVVKGLPWDKDKKGQRPWTDDDLGATRCYLGKSPYNITRTPKLDDVFSLLRFKNRKHPIKDHLKGFVWDGTERLEELLIVYLGAENNEYTKAVIVKTVVASVARIFEPGKKFDNVLVLVGPQGCGKSTFFRLLGMGYHTDTVSFHTMQSKAAFEQIQKKLIVELAELSGMRKAETELIKNFISSQEDTFRPAYGREAVTLKRQCVFVGTTNNRDFLRDPSGNRRFWPVDTMARAPTKNIFKDFTESEVHQVWAEAVHLYKKGEALYLSPEIEAKAIAVQEEHSEYNEQAGLIEKYLNMDLPGSWNEMSSSERFGYFMEDDAIKEKATIQREKVCVAEIFCEVFNSSMRDLTRLKAKELHDIMRQMTGWKEHKSKMRFELYGIQRAYLKSK